MKPATLTIATLIREIFSAVLIPQNGKVDIRLPSKIVNPMARGPLIEIDATARTV